MLRMELVHCWYSPAVTEPLDVEGVPFTELREERSLAPAEIFEVPRAQLERVANEVDQLLRRPGVVAFLAPHIGPTGRTACLPL